VPIAFKREKKKSTSISEDYSDILKGGNKVEDAMRFD
jgi:hypothetical protein